MPIKGNAGFKYTPIGGSYEHVVPLNAPLYDIAPAFVGTRYEHENLLRTSIDVVEIAGGIEEVTCRIAYEKASWALLRMLEAGARGATLNYYPDLSVPGESYPLRLIGAGEEIRLAPDNQMWRWGRYERALRLRRVDGGTLGPLYSPVLFRYFAGMDWSAATFARTDAAYQMRRASYGSYAFTSNAAAVLRDEHWMLNPTTGLLERATLIERTRTNLATRSEPTLAQLALSNNVTDAAATVHGLAAMIQFQAASSLDHAYVAAIVAAGTQYVASAIVIMNDRTAPVLGDNVTGDMSLVVGGQIVSQNLRVQSIGDGAYRISGSITPAATPNNNFGVARYVAQSDKAFRVSAFQLEAAPNQTVPSSYHKTEGAADARADETLRFPLSVGAVMPLTVYVRHFERGNGFAGAAAGVFHIGGATSTAEPRLEFYGRSAGGYQARYEDAYGTVLTANASGTEPPYGALLEHIVALNPNGAITTQQAINGAQATGATSSSAGAVAGSWSASTIYLGGLGGLSDIGLAAITDVKIARGIRALAEMRSL